MVDKDCIHIDVEAVLYSKLGSKKRWVPKPLVRWLERVICQDELNRMLKQYHPRRGADFCDACVEDLAVSVDVKAQENWPEKKDGRVIFVCNHPLGGLDGIVLISQLSKLYGSGVKFVVNDLLMAVEPLQDVFLPINKHGKQSRASIQAINEAMAGDSPVLVFPAGLVSRRGKGGKVADLDWHKMFVTKAVQYKRDVVPLHFSGQNSDFFYNVARWRKRLGLKFNIEMVYLPREVIRARGSKYTITVGPRIPWERFKGGEPERHAQSVKELAYSLKEL